MGDRTNSLCAVYADLVEHELEKTDPDKETVKKLLGYIRKYCHVVAFPPGDTPPHLEEHLFTSED